jgi:hypothetical protein
MSEQPADDAPETEPTLMEGITKMPAKDQRTLGCLAIVAVLAVLLVGGWIWSALFGSGGDDRTSAYYACVDVISKDAPAAKFKSDDSATYSGSDGSWTITSTFTVLGSTVGWTCKAERVSEDYYRIKWE